MKILISKYQITPRSSLNSLVTTSKKARDGALLKIQWMDGRIGYADLHPWPELGDDTLEEQLSDLKKGRISSQLEQSIWCADQDSKLRESKKNIFEVGAKVSNNFTLSDYKSAPDGMLDEIRKADFKTIKMKAGLNLEEEANFVARMASANFKVRLDFNAALSFQSFHKFLGLLTPRAKMAIEYIEDPFQFDAQQWTKASELIPLALDREVTRVKWDELPAVLPFQYLILKPAKDDVDKTVQKAIQHRLKVTVTSNMDHAVGVLHALAVAMKLQKDFPSMMCEAGCLTQNLFQLNECSAAINTSGPFFQKTQGYGIGLEKELNAVSWQAL